MNTIEEIFKRNYKSLTLLVHRMVGCVDVAEDIVQELFVKIINNKVDLSKMSDGYLMVMARNAAVDYLRKQSGNTVELTDKLPNSATAVVDVAVDVAEQEHIEKVSQLYRAIESLPPKSREVFKMISIERYSYSYTAAKLGMSEGTVKTHMYRAMLFLRKYFAEHHIEYV